MNDPAGADLDRLVHDGAWLKHFVGTLVRAQDVDDVTQASWLAAVEGREHVHGGIANWLRGVASNLARMLHRSDRRRERAVQRLPMRGNAPSAADAVAGLEVQRVVSDALLALPEPTRTIVVLRYHEGMSPAAIAARVGLRADAVRQRLHRGREAVCERLQQRFGAEWRGSLAVAAFVRDARNTMPLVGVVALTTTALAGAALVATALAVGLRADAPAVEPAAARAELSAARREPTASLAASVSLPERVPVAEQVQDPAPPAAVPPKIEVRGRLVAAEDKSPIAGAAILRDGHASVPLVTSDHDGRFVIAYDANAKRFEIWFRADGRCERWCEQAPPGIDLGEIELRRGYVVRGRVVDEKGMPIPKVRVAATLDGAVPSGGMNTFLAITKADGTFAFRPLMPAGPLELRSETRGLALVDGKVDVAAKSEPNEFVLRARRLLSVSGVVFDPEGRPCANVRLKAFATQEFPTQDPRSGTRSLFESLGFGLSQKDGSFSVYRDSESEEAFLGVEVTGPHELVGPRIAIEWGASGVRVVVRPLIPVRLLVVEAESGKPVTTFTALSVVLHGTWNLQTGSDSPPRELPDGRYTFEGLPANAHVVVFAADPERAPVVMVVDESMRTQPEVRVALAKLQPFALALVDGRGAPLASEFDLIDRRGIAAPSGWSDYVGGRRMSCSNVPVSPFRVSGGSTDAQGKGTLRAPTDHRDLAVRLSRGKQNVWLPVVLPANGKPLRLVVPD